jgi:hypothetical protein
MNCKTCGKSCEKEYCFQHKPRTQLNQCVGKPSLSSKKRLSGGKSTQKSSLFYKKLLDIFLDIPNNCYIFT